MKFIRIGNNVNVSWSITRYGESENLSEKNIQVFLIDKFKHRQKFEYTIEGNVIKGIFYGRYQVHTGVYRLLLIENEGTEEQVILDYIDCFTLSQKLKNSTSVGDDASSTIETDIVEVTSEINTGSLDGYATKEYVDEAVENAVIGTVDLSSYAKKDEIPIKLSTLENDTEYVNKTELGESITNATEDIKSSIPTKVSNLENDAKYITSDSIPTKVSQLSNDSKYVNEITLEAEKSSLTAQISTKVETTTFNNKVAEIEGKVANIKVPTKVSELTNDSGYLTKHQDLTNYATKQYVDNSINNLDLNVDVDLTPYLKKTDASMTYQQKGDYVDKDYVASAISGKADTTSIPTKTSQLKNDSGYATETYVTEKVEEAVTSGIDLTSYAKKTDIPTKNSQLTNDNNYITSTVLDNKGYISTETDPVFNASPAASISKSDITNWNSKTSFDGNYNSLTNKPTIPSTTGELTNNSGFITSSSLNGYAKSADIPTKVSQLTNDKGYLTEHQSLEEYETTKDVDTKLSLKADKTDIPTVPTKISELINDSGYLTEHQSLTDYAKKTDIPSNISELNNDANYTTKTYVDTAIVNASTGEVDLSSYATKEYVDSSIGDIKIPTKTSELTNDSGYLTQHQDLSSYALKSEIPSIPTKTSELTNDSGFLTSHQDISGKQDKLTEAQLSNLNEDHSKYLTEHQSLVGYATETYVTNATSSLLSKTDAVSTYQPKGNYITDISGKQDKLTEEQLANINADHTKYLTEHQDLSNYATKSYVSTAIANASIGGGGSSVVPANFKFVENKSDNENVLISNYAPNGVAFTNTIENIDFANGQYIKVDLDLSTVLLSGSNTDQEIFCIGDDITEWYTTGKVKIHFYYIPSSKTIQYTYMNGSSKVGQYNIVCSGTNIIIKIANGSITVDGNTETFTANTGLFALTSLSYGSNPSDSKISTATYNSVSIVTPATDGLVMQYSLGSSTESSVLPMDNYATKNYVTSLTWLGTETEYNALTSTDDNVIYMIEVEE